jgi:hypothetical protein
MRPFAMVLFWLIQGHCHAQQESLVSCMVHLAADPRFALLAPKLAVGTVTSALPAMLADTSIVNNQERPIIAEWAAARGACIKADSKYGNAAYRPPLQNYVIEAENKVMGAAAELYDRSISFGEFNRQRQAIAERLLSQTAGLSQQIQSQRTVQEQADRQSREREQTHREIEDAELRATMARQQAEQAQESAARFSSSTNRRGSSRGYRPASIARHRNCFRFGTRITCTSW